MGALVLTYRLHTKAPRTGLFLPTCRWGVWSCGCCPSPGFISIRPPADLLWRLFLNPFSDLSSSLRHFSVFLSFFTTPNRSRYFRKGLKEAKCYRKTLQGFKSSESSIINTTFLK